MGTAAEHIACANRTQKTIAHLLSGDQSVHSPWIAVTAFYKAIQLVEAVFSGDPKVRHTSSHDERDGVMRHNRRYGKIYTHFRELKSAARNARYLSNCADFDDYLPPNEVIDKLLKHHLHQLELSAIKLMANPATAFDSINSAFPPNPSVS
jgi:hypothetical protein